MKKVLAILISVFIFLATIVYSDSPTIPEEKPHPMLKAKMPPKTNIKISKPNNKQTIKYDKMKLI